MIHRPAPESVLADTQDLAVRAPALRTADFARRVAAFLADKQAEDIVVLDIRRSLAIVDYFVVATVRSTRQSQAIAKELDFDVKHQRGRRKRNQGGLESEDSNWVLLDFDDIVVHLFLPEARTYYGLESLWADAPRLDLSTARPELDAPPPARTVAKKLQLFPPPEGAK